MAENTEDLAFQALEAKESKEKIKSLGKLASKEKPQLDERIKMVIGLHQIPMTELSFNGAFYPAGTTIKYRSADGKEIRHFSMVDETNPLAVDDAMKQLINSCVHIYNEKGAKLAFGNIQASDRFLLMMKVREVTYPNPESKLSYEAHCSCGQAMSIELDSTTMVRHEFNEHQKKYYDENERCFVVPTKSYGVVKAYPATIFREQIYRDYVTKEVEKGQKVDTFFAELFWLFVTPHNQHDKDAVENAYQKYRSLGKEELAFYVKMNEMLKLKPTTQVRDICPDESCGREVYKDITFPNGIKYLFVDTTSADSEFL